jgi:hypothetical protein
VIPEIIHSYARALEFLRRLVADVPDELFTAQRNVVLNHPAWVIGHLIQSAQAIGGEIGLAEWLPDTWGQRFGSGSTPVSEREAYPSKETLLEMLAEAERRITTRLTEIGQGALAEPLPDERYREVFPTIGHAVLHILTSHASIHIGQLTVWRRVTGFGPLNEPFV